MLLFSDFLFFIHLYYNSHSQSWEHLLKNKRFNTDEIFLKSVLSVSGRIFCFKMNFDVSFECCPWNLNKFAKTVLHSFQNIAGSEEKVTQRHTVEWAIILLVWNRHDDVHLNRVCTPKPSWMIRGSEIESYPSSFSMPNHERRVEEAYTVQDNNL